MTEESDLRVRSEQIAERLTTIEARLRAVGRDDIEIVAVSKTFPAMSVAAAALAGLSTIGESYAQEFEAKHSEYQQDFASDRDFGVPPVSWQFIGGLQRNKIRRIASLVDLWQSVDRIPVAIEIAKRAPGAAVLLQVDISGEDSKGGCPAQEIEALLDGATNAGLDVRGLMTIGPLADPEAARPGFALVRRLADQLDLAVVSMGMSADLEVAASEGSTMVRVGSALFGDRSSS
ncbi:MAG: YggS family pyridoxal phosphate-dependent enzyme [Acidimicrobiales bacterium]